MPRGAGAAPPPAAPRRADAAPHAAPAPAPAAADGAGRARSCSTASTPSRCAAPPARIVANMEASLEVPTATSVRAVPAKLLEVNRQILNNHLARARGGKVSFTHLIGFAVLRALRDGAAR